MADDLRPLPSADQWRAAHVQMIAFCPASQLATQDVWKDLTGSEPESVTKKAAERKEVGPWKGHSLSLDVDPLRVSWTVSPILDLENLSTPLPTLGPFPTITDQFADLAVKWLSSDTCPEITRLAFICRLMQFTQEREEAYGLLDAYLHRVDVSPESTDLQYRINWKRPLQTGQPGLIVNRLSGWLCVQFNFEVRAQLLGTPSKATLAKENKFACMLELDVNTDAENKSPLDKNAMPAVFRELTEMATEIAARGDVP